MPYVRRNVVHPSRIRDITILPLDTLLRVGAGLVSRGSFCVAPIRPTVSDILRRFFAATIRFTMPGSIGQAVIVALAAWLLIGWIRARDARRRRDAEWTADRGPRRRRTRRRTHRERDVDGGDGR